MHLDSNAKSLLSNFEIRRLTSSSLHFGGSDKIRILHRAPGFAATRRKSWRDIKTSSRSASFAPESLGKRTLWQFRALFRQCLCDGRLDLPGVWPMKSAHAPNLHLKTAILRCR